MKQVMGITTLLVLMIMGLAFQFSDQEPDNDRKSLQQLSGTYQDEKGVDWGRGTFGRRVFTFDKGKWTLTFTLALDEHLTQPVFVFRTKGTYTVLDASKTVPGAFNALFKEDSKWLTLKTGDERLAQGFGLSACGLSKDVEKDISVTGCSLWKPVSICNEDHDLLKLDKEGKLYFGSRPPDNDMCTADKRPRALTVPVIKVN